MATKSRREELQKAAMLLETLTANENSSHKNQKLIEGKKEQMAIRLSKLPLFSCQKCQKTVEVDESIEEEIKEKKEKRKEEKKEGNEEDEEDEFNIQDYFSSQAEKTNTNHPYCIDCAYSFFRDTSELIDEFDRENFRFSNFINFLSSENIAELPSLDDEILQLEKEEREIFSSIKEIEEQRNQLNNEAHFFTYQYKKMEFIDSQFWEYVSDFDIKINEFYEEKSAIMQQKRSRSNHLNKLRKTNPLNDSFHIWYDGHFGTINHLRLGTLPAEPVDWMEINAALGQTSLLILILARSLNISFKEYTIHPMGSMTRIERNEDNSIYELFDSREITLGRLFWYRRFDNAMIGVLRCISELIDCIQSLDSSYHPPYLINRDKIGDQNIKKQFNSDEGWTKALKFMLCNLKSILNWVSKRKNFL